MLKGIKTGTQNMDTEDIHTQATWAAQQLPMACNGCMKPKKVVWGGIWTVWGPISTVSPKESYC